MIAVRTNPELKEVSRGVIRPATPTHLRHWLARFQGRRVAGALEATTGWRFVVEELEAAGVEAHLAEPEDLALAVIDRMEEELGPIDRQLTTYARRRPGCRTLMRNYGIGAMTAIAILSELEDARRFSSSRKKFSSPGVRIPPHHRLFSLRRRRGLGYGRTPRS